MFSFNREIIWEQEHGKTEKMSVVYQPENDGYMVTGIDIGMLKYG